MEGHPREQRCAIAGVDGERCFVLPQRRLIAKNAGMRGVVHLPQEPPHREAPRQVGLAGARRTVEDDLIATPQVDVQLKEDRIGFDYLLGGRSWGLWRSAEGCVGIGRG